MYSTAQFKLDRTRVQHGLDTTRFSSHTHASMRACAHKIDDNKPTVQSSRVRTRRVHDACVHVRNAHANLDYVCMQIVSQGQQNKLHKNVHVLRCNPLVIQDVNPAK